MGGVSVLWHKRSSIRLLVQSHLLDLVSEGKGNLSKSPSSLLEQFGVNVALVLKVRRYELPLQEANEDLGVSPAWDYGVEVLGCGVACSDGPPVEALAGDRGGDTDLRCLGYQRANLHCTEYADGGELGHGGGGECSSSGAVGWGGEGRRVVGLLGGWVKKVRWVRCCKYLVGVGGERKRGLRGGRIGR